MKRILFYALFLGSLVACKGKSSKTFDNTSYEKVKESLAEKEMKNPARFLSVKNHDRKNLIGQTVVIGNIQNNATLCWYRDVELRLSYFSKTGVKLDEALETVYENIAPGKSAKFKTRSFAPRGTDSVAVLVLNAKGDTTHAH